VLTEYRSGLDAVASALLERETLEGAEVGRLVDDAMGRKVGGPRVIVHADGTEEPATTPIAPADGLTS
jgi:cell division protease FtsH